MIYGLVATSETVDTVSDSMYLFSPKQWFDALMHSTTSIEECGLDTLAHSTTSIEERLYYKRE